MGQFALNLSEPATKRCPDCGKVLPLKAFHVNQKVCKACKSIRYQKDQRQSPDYMYRQYIIRAEKRGHTFGLSTLEFERLWGRPCFYCGKAGRGNGIDRVKNHVGYEIGNAVSCCKQCNMAKGIMDANEFVSMCVRVASNNPELPFDK